MTEDSSLQARLAALIEALPDRRLLVIGDLIADQFVSGEIARISREAPVMILKYEDTRTLPGGAGNAASNVAALAAKVTLVGAVGRDRAGRGLLLALRALGVDTSGVVTIKDHVTPVKVRILAGSVHSTRQQVIRIDREAPLEPTEAITEQLLQRIRQHAATADAIIISDYNYGVVNERVIEVLRQIGRERQIPIAVDSRFRLPEFGQFTTATPNESEVEEVLDTRFNSLAEVIAAGQQLREELDLEALLITRGANGMVLFEREQAPVSIPIVGGRDVVDVTGAGDTVIATYSLALASGASFAEAAQLATHAGGLVVMKRGTATISREELLASVARWSAAE